MSERNWFIARNGQQEGPFPDSQIKSLLAAGQLTGETFVWTEGMADWRRAAEIPDLMAAPLPGAGSSGAGVPAAGYSPALKPGAAQSGAPVEAVFGVWPLLGYVLLAAIGVVLVIPAPWVMTTYYRWVISKLRVPSVPDVGFSGKPGDIWWAFILMGALIYVGRVHEWYLPLATFIANAALGWVILRWVIANVTSQGRPLALAFTGDVWSYIGWSVFLSVSFITIIGWAWVVTAWMRWICRNVADASRAVTFTASGWEVLWRTVVFVLACIFIIPIPWMLHWYARWYASQLSVGWKAA